MDYAQRERSLANHLPSITLVVVLHIALGYALVTGLARKVIEVIKAPIETKIIEEIKKPPPDTPPPPPPKLAPPPPPFIPPPEINIQIPTISQAPTITTVTTTPPPPGPPPVAPRPQVQSVVRQNIQPLPGFAKPIFPRPAIQAGITHGVVTAYVYVRPDGSVSEVKIMSASPQRVFDREVIRALSQWRFKPEPVGFIAEVPIEFNLRDE